MDELDAPWPITEREEWTLNGSTSWKQYRLGSDDLAPVAVVNSGVQNARLIAQAPVMRSALGEIVDLTNSVQASEDPEAALAAVARLASRALSALER